MIRRYLNGETRHTKAVQKQFSNWFAEMFKKTDEAVARRVLKYMHVDSWELYLEHFGK